MSTSHLDRKSLKRPDAFLERAGGVMSFVSENSGLVLGLVALLFTAGLGTAFYTNYAEHRAEEADSALFDARKHLDKGTAEVEKVAKDFSGTRAAFEAELLLGDAALKAHDSAKAIERYKAAVDAARPRAARPAAQYALAYAYEDAKNHDGAIQALHDVLASGSVAFKADAMMALARNLALKGDKPKAIEAYGQVSKDFPNSALSKLAEAESSKLR